MPDAEATVAPPPSTTSAVACRCPVGPRSGRTVATHRYAAPTAEVVDGGGATVASASGTYQPASPDASRQHLALSDADRRLLDEAMSTVSTQREDHTSGRDRG